MIHDYYDYYHEIIIMYIYIYILLYVYIILLYEYSVYELDFGPWIPPWEAISPGRWLLTRKNRSGFP